MRGVVSFVTSMALSVVPISAFAIFSNGGFELNNYSSWTVASGRNPGLSGSAPFTGANIVINAGGSNVSTIVGALTDPRAPQLTLPRVGNYTAKVNDENSGAIINTAAQTDTITAADRDAGDGKLHVRFSYAPVLEDPGHGPNDQPYFYVRLRDATSSAMLFEDFSFSNDSARTWITTNYNSSTWKSTNWNNADIVVPESSLGHQLEIYLVAADCSLGAHGGYVYLDGFGSAPPGPGPAPVPTTPQDVPTLRPFALVLLASLVLLGGFAASRRRKN